MVRWETINPLRRYIAAISFLYYNKFDPTCPLLFFIPCIGLLLSQQTFKPILITREMTKVHWLRLYFPGLLRTVPTIVIAHTFCASRDTRISYGWCLLIQGYFCAVQNYAKKAELSKWSRYPKRKLGVTAHFSEIIIISFSLEMNAIHCFGF